MTRHYRIEGKRNLQAKQVADWPFTIHSTPTEVMATTVQSATIFLELIIAADCAADAAKLGRKAEVQFDWVSEVEWVKHDEPEADPDTGEEIAGEWVDKADGEHLDVIGLCEACEDPVMAEDKWFSDPEDGCIVCEKCGNAMAAAEGSEAAAGEEAV